MNKWNSSPISGSGPSTIILAVLLLALLYLVIAETRYRFKHPELTETQLFLQIPDALMWK